MPAWTPPPGMLPMVAKSWREFYTAIGLKYGITHEEYRAIYLAQRGRCFICRRAKGKHPDDPKGLGGRRLGVDHNHMLGNRREAVRGLLCTGGARTCNQILGWLRDDPGAFARGVVHLTEAPAQSVLAAVQDGMTDEQILGMVIKP